MKIFVSWSGRTSREAAVALARFIPRVLQRTAVYVADEQIETGARWYAELTDAMNSADFGIACLTKDNINNPWLAFEIGALSARLEPTRVFPVLVDFSFSELTGPLATFQALKLEKADMRRLLAQINEASDDVRLERSVLDTVFERFWPTFEEQTRFKLASVATSTTKATDSDERDTILNLQKMLKELKERIERLEKGA